MDESPLQFIKPVPVPGSPFGPQETGGVIRTAQPDRFRTAIAAPTAETAPVPPPTGLSFDLYDLRAKSDDELRAILQKGGLTDEQRRPVSRVLADRFSSAVGVVRAPQMGSARPVAVATPPVAQDPAEIASKPQTTFLGDLKAVLFRHLPPPVADFLLHKIVHGGDVPAEHLKE